MTTFADHQHPRATDGKFTATAHAEATVSLEQPSAPRVTVEDALTGVLNEALGRLLVEQTRQAITESGPQPWPRTPAGHACLERYFPEGTEIFQDPGGSEETKLVASQGDGHLLFERNSGEHDEYAEFEANDLFGEVNVIHVP